MPLKGIEPLSVNELPARRHYGRSIVALQLSELTQQTL
jgi:hypothetical protein